VTFGYFCSNAFVISTIAFLGPSPVSELTTRSVTGPRLSKPSVLTFCAVDSVVDAAGFF